MMNKAELEGVFGTDIIRVMNDQCIDCGRAVPVLNFSNFAEKINWVCACGRDNSPKEEECKECVCGNCGREM